MSVLTPLKDFAKACHVTYLAARFYSVAPGAPSRGAILQKIIQCEAPRKIDDTLNISHVFEGFEKRQKAYRLGKSPYKPSRLESSGLLQQETKAIIEMLLRCRHGGMASSILNDRFHTVSKITSMTSTHDSLNRMRALREQTASRMARAPIR